MKKDNTTIRDSYVVPDKLLKEKLNEVKEEFDYINNIYSVSEDDNAHCRCLAIEGTKDGKFQGMVMHLHLQEYSLKPYTSLLVACSLGYDDSYPVRSSWIPLDNLLVEMGSM